MASRKPQPVFYDAWPTAWGPMGAAASRDGLLRVILPHYKLDDLLAMLAWQNQGAARSCEPFGLLIELSRDYFNGQIADFSWIVCDKSVIKPQSFTGRVLSACREIPHGRTMSYSALAEKIGRADAARALAAALGKNPLPLVIPCHRVIYADGSAGGFSADGGPELKKRMLAMERRK